VTAAIDLGHEFGPIVRTTPDGAGVAAYIGAADMTEPMFSEPALARALGYRGLVVPGPMLAAFLEQFVRAELPDWRIERLSVTFRIPTIVGDKLVLRGVVTEHHELADAERIVCDVLIEHREGERAVTGTATLRRELKA
jgi:acyl dehydratase